MFSAPTPITSAHNVTQFDCGSGALNEFLTKYALLNTSAGIARTFVTTLEGQVDVAGYFSLAAGSIEPAQAPERIAKGVPRHAIPVILLEKKNCHLHGAGYIAKAFEAITVVQNAMQRVGLTGTPFEAAGLPLPPEVLAMPETAATAATLPNSFDEWLASPSQSINPNEEPDQGVFVDLMKEIPPKISGNPLVQIRRR